MSYTYELKPFESKIKYSVLDRFPNNKKFNIPLWKPGEKKNCSEIVIMLNGFLEGVASDPKKRDKYLIRYKLIGEKLNQSNIAAVLMPMPFHFMRSDDIEGNAPVVRLSEHGSYLYHGGYDQVISDVEKLTNEIRKQPEEFGLYGPGEKVKIHLLGYSLGGVAAIGASIQLKSQQFESLTVLLSSWNISEIDPNAIERVFRKNFDFGKQEWNKMLNELRKNEIGDDIFKQLFWGAEDVTMPPPERVKRILFIHGLKDEIFPRDMTSNKINSIINQQENCSFIFLPDNHSAIRYRKPIAGYISNFIANPCV
jgi:hypothetical protein